MRIIKLLAGLLWLLSAPLPAAAHEHGAKQQGVLSLDVYRDGGLLHVLTLEIDARHARRLLYRQSSDDGRTWIDAARIDRASGSIYDLTRGNDAQIAASGRRILVLWTAKGSGYAGSGPLMSAVSNDGGRTWQAGGNPADDKSGAGHAYAELSAHNGVFDAVWLDGRDGAQGLRHARSRDGVHWEKNTTVQAATCECCWQSLAQHDNELLAMFRGKQPRDMTLAVLSPGTSKWSTRGRVGRFNWDFKGCPHTGGSLAVVPRDKTLHALTWTGAQGMQGLHHLWSRDGGANWNTGRRLGTADAQRADTAVSDDGKTLAAAWDQLEGSRRLIYAAYSADSGRTWSDATRQSGSRADAIYPRIVAVRSGFLVLWSERQDSGANVLQTAPFLSRQ